MNGPRTNGPARWAATCWRLLPLFGFAFLALFGAPPASGQGLPDTRSRRLHALAELDGAVHYFHPDEAVHPGRWDSSFAALAPGLADAPTSAAYAAHLARLLSQVGDPASRIVDRCPAAWQASAARGGLVLVRPSALPLRGAVFELETANAKSLLVDLRGENGPLPERYLARLVLPHPASAPAQRALVYAGFPSPEANARRFYHRSWETRQGESFPGGEGRPIAFLVDSASVLPPLALALRSTGRGAIIGIGTARVRPAAETYSLDMGEGVSVQVRTAQRLVDTSDVGLAVDTIVADSAAAVGAARAWAARTLPAWPEAAQDTGNVVPVPPAPGGAWSAPYPRRGYRLLAAARLWSTLHFFFPYKHELGDDWNAAFAAAAPLIEAAPDSIAYLQALARMAAHLQDSHVRFWRGRTEPLEPFGGFQVPAVTSFVEGQLVVLRVLDPTTARAGLAPGDIVTAIDGESSALRSARLAPYVAASTPQALRVRLASIILSAQDSTAAELTVLPVRGPERRLHIPRTFRPQQFRPYGPPSRAGPIVRLLHGNIGYIDLERITESMVDSAFAALRSARGIVFDGRGYPETEAPVRIMELLNRRPAVPVARFEELVVPSPDTTRTTVQGTSQLLPTTAGPHYDGRVALLIDERAISYGEHLGLFFETAARPILVGLPTTGADAAFAFVQLPGGIRMSYSGIRVRHGDGRPLQRVGLQPDIAVAPTVAGVRAGRDEVLERAAACLSDELCLANPVPH